MSRELRLLAVVRLDELLVPYLAPLASHPEVAEVVILRHAPGPPIPRAAYLCPPSAGTGPWNLVARRLRLGTRAWQAQRFDGAAAFTWAPHGWIARRIARRFGAPVHLAIPGTDLFTHARRWWLRPWILRGIRSCDTVSVTGSEHEEMLLRAGVSRDRLFVLPKGIDADRFRPTGEPPRWDVAFVGRLHDQKRPMLWLESFARLLRERPGSRGVVVGDGPLRARTEGEARRMRSWSDPSRFPRRASG